MGWIKTQKVIQRLNFYVAVVGMSFIIPLMLLTTFDVIGRKFFSKTIPGNFEISEYILATFILLGAAYTQQVKGHVGVDFLTSRLSPHVRMVCEIITTLLSLFWGHLRAHDGGRTYYSTRWAQCLHHFRGGKRGIHGRDFSGNPSFSDIDYNDCYPYHHFPKDCPFSSRNDGPLSEGGGRWGIRG